MFVELKKTAQNYPEEKENYKNNDECVTTFAFTYTEKGVKDVKPLIFGIKVEGMPTSI